MRAMLSSDCTKTVTGARSIRNATAEADELLRNLDELGRCAADAVGLLAIKLGSSAVDNANKVAQFCEAVQSFSTTTLKRLELEEKKLFPVARSVISGEAWFSIANQMLAHDAYVQESRPLRQSSIFLEQPYEQARQQRVAANLVH